MQTPTLRLGFTLVELIVVIGIIAVLAAIMIPTATLMMTASRKEMARSEIAGMAMALDQYRRGGIRALPPDMSGSPKMTIHTSAASLSSRQLTNVLMDGSRYDFDIKRLTSDGRYLDPFGESYRYDVIKDGASFIIMSFGPNRQFDGVNASPSTYNPKTSDDIFNPEFDPANPNR